MFSGAETGDDAEGVVAAEPPPPRKRLVTSSLLARAALAGVEAVDGAVDATVEEAFEEVEAADVEEVEGVATSGLPFVGSELAAIEPKVGTLFRASVLTAGVD